MLASQTLKNTKKELKKIAKALKTSPSDLLKGF